MSRLRALAAFDALDSEDWQTIKPKRISREAFREALEDGRVEPAVVMRNIEVAKRVAEVEVQLAGLLDLVEAMPIHRNVDMRNVLEVVA